MCSQMFRRIINIIMAVTGPIVSGITYENIVPAFLSLCSPHLLNDFFSKKGIQRFPKAAILDCWIYLCPLYTHLYHVLPKSTKEKGRVYGIIPQQRRTYYWGGSTTNGRIIFQNVNGITRMPCTDGISESLFSLVPSAYEAYGIVHGTGSQMQWMIIFDSRQLGHLRRPRNRLRLANLPSWKIHDISRSRYYIDQHLLFHFASTSFSVWSRVETYLKQHIIITRPGVNW